MSGLTKIEEKEYSDECKRIKETKEAKEEINIAQIELRKKLINEIYNVITQYCRDCNDENIEECSGLSPVEILGIIEYLKLSYFYQHEFNFLLKLNDDERLAKLYRLRTLWKKKCD